MEVATIFAGLFDGGKGGGVWILFQRQQKVCFSLLPYIYKATVNMYGTCLLRKEV
jgi:hypothetical protein